MQIKNNENILKKVLCGKEKDVPLHSQNNGNGAAEKGRGCWAKFFERMIQAKSER